MIASCTKRKRAPVPDGRRLRAFSGFGVRKAVGEWISALERCAERRPAVDMYAGDYWQSVLAARKALPGLSTRLWVLSAGYGLILEDSEIVSYSATFSRGHADDVAVLDPHRRREDVLRSWWDEITASRPVVDAQAHQVRDLAESGADAFVFLVSPAYLKVVAADVEVLADRVGASRVALFSAGLRTPNLANSVMRYGGNLQNSIGGGLNSLNARAYGAAVQMAGSVESHALQAALDVLSTQAGRRKEFRRERRSDAEIRTMIEDDLRVAGRRGWSRALRMFRDERGIACEQKRFKHLYDEAAAKAGVLE
jgi:hypothetical protein